MVPESEKIDFRPIEIPQVRRDFSGYLKIATAGLAVAGGMWAWHAGYRPAMLTQAATMPLDVAEIDQGNVDIIVVEYGTVESANNATVRCQVEALIGTVGGTQGGTQKGSSSSSSSSGNSGQGSSAGGSGGAQSGSGTDTQTAKTSKTKKKAGSSSSSKSGSGTSSSSSKSSSGSSGSSSGSSSSTASSGSSSTSSSGSGGGSGSGSGGSGSSGGGSSGGSSGLARPVIRSFAYQVTAHQPLRPVTAKAAQTPQQQQQQQQKKGSGGGGGRGGRGGRGGGGGGMNGMDEKPGSTRILEILPEGSHVKAGEIVAKLDGAPYEDEEQAQKIRHLQAKAYVEQAASLLDVAEITLREYRDGIYPQDLQLIRDYIETCRLEATRLKAAYEWSLDMQKKNFRTQYQVTGDRLSLQQSKIALAEAEGMLDRLVKQTGPKIIKSLEANVKAIKSDKLTQEASFSLEDQRLKRIQKNIEHCTVRAPGEGIVVYVNQTDRWGTMTQPIAEGITLRQDQPIFSLPDPNRMRVKARINESKVTMIHTGQRVIVTVDAFADRPLHGTVGEITAINTPLNASDVRIYYANVDLDKGFDDLRPGLSAEVAIRVDSRARVTRVPLESVRWVNDQAYVAVYLRQPGDADDGRPAWRWRVIELGLSDTQFAEVSGGLQVGDRIVATPRGLPTPTPETTDSPATSVADLSVKPGD